MSHQLDRLESAVRKAEGILESGRVFVSGIADRIRALFPDNAKADALAAELEAKADAFAAALEANQTLPGEDVATPAGMPVDVEPTPATDAPTDAAPAPFEDGPSTPDLEGEEPKPVE